MNSHTFTITTKSPSLNWSELTLTVSNTKIDRVSLNPSREAISGGGRFFGATQATKSGFLCFVPRRRRYQFHCRVTNNAWLASLFDCCRVSAQLFHSLYPQFIYHFFINHHVSYVVVVDPCSKVTVPWIGCSRIVVVTRRLVVFEFSQDERVRNNGYLEFRSSVHRHNVHPSIHFHSFHEESYIPDHILGYSSSRSSSFLVFSRA